MAVVAGSTVAIGGADNDCGPGWPCGGNSYAWTNISARSGSTNWTKGESSILPTMTGTVTLGVVEGSTGLCLGGP